MTKGDRYLLVGLGNPGKGYENTRHNVGFRALEQLASEKGWTFREAKRLQGALAEGVIEGKKVFLLLPETYMNSSGEAVRACVSYYDIPLSQVCVVCDDIHLSFGRLRVKASGGSGGHNGLKSLSSHLGEEDYPRLRIGIGGKGDRELSDFVLSSFTKEEKEQLPHILPKAAKALELFVTEGIVEAMQEVNTSREKPEELLGE